MKQFKTFFKTTVGRKPQSEAGGGVKTAEDASKEELREELKKHEERETPAQEKAESKHEQEVERKAGVEKCSGVKKLADAAHAVMSGAFGSADSAPAPTPAPADVGSGGGLGSSIAGSIKRAIGG